MSAWLAILLIAGAGSVGGLINAFLASEGFVLSRMEQLADGRSIWRPGFIGNMLRSKLLHAMSRLSDSVQAASPADAASRADVLHLISEFISETALRRLARLEPQTRDELAEILARLEQPRTLGRSDLGRLRHRLVELMSKPA